MGEARNRGTREERKIEALNNLPFKQPWRWENCGASGEIRYGSESSKLFIVNNIKKDHANLSPHCSFDVDRIKVWVSEDDPSKEEI